MPELPEVETTRRGLLPRVKGARIDSVELRRPDLRRPITKGLAKRVAGARVTNIRRRAKYLLMDLDSGETLLIHLGMSGSLRVIEAKKEYAPRKHDHVVFHLENGDSLVFHDPRRFGLLLLLNKGEEETHPLLTHLGSEPLSKSFNAKYLEAALSKRSGPVKPALMDQKLVVGVGNIYASESLFLAKIDPRAPAKSVAPRSAKLADAIKTTLKKALASGGSSLRDYVGADGREGYFQHRFNVYERAGKKCFTARTSSRRRHNRGVRPTIVRIASVRARRGQKR
ncbi:MAG: bifunctional DNA-formamidopyrimidine glycosylase/DNA-(apurinic or apyrimidinic site) lyase [Alphaproteobacteria bacterium]